MVVFSISGVTYHALRNAPDETLKSLTSVQLVPEPANTFDKRAIAVYVLDNNGGKTHAGYVPRLQLPHAHREKWAGREWKVQEAGRWTPPHARVDVPYCKVVDVEAHLVSSPTRGRVSMKQRIRQDDTLYDGKTCVSIYYASASSGLTWRDVVLKSKTQTSFFACDGTHDKQGRPIPRKEFKFAHLDDAAELPEWEVSAFDIEDRPAKRAKP
jgi:hypothetical protein